MSRFFEAEYNQFIREGKYVQFSEAGFFDAYMTRRLSPDTQRLTTYSCVLDRKHNSYIGVELRFVDQSIQGRKSLSGNYWDAYYFYKLNPYRGKQVHIFSDMEEFKVDNWKQRDREAYRGVYLLQLIREIPLNQRGFYGRAIHNSELRAPRGVEKLDYLYTAFIKPATSVMDYPLQENVDGSRRIFFDNEQE